MISPSPAPLRHAVVLAHPDEHSFNAAIANAYCEAVRKAGQETVLRDLYRMHFDPVLKNEERPDTKGFHLSEDVRAELNVLDGAQMFAFVFPIWFGMPPAIMKGYVDRVLGAGVSARQLQEKASPGLLGKGHLCTITTSGAPDEWLDAQGQKDALRGVASSYLFRAFGMRSAETLHIGDVTGGQPPAFFEDNLERVRRRAREICARLAQEAFGHPLPPDIADGS